MGSSPLARGLRTIPQPCDPHHRIIPARAGFTPGRVSALALFRDHPRSRGVYSAKSKRYILLHGSSPLARGLLSRRGSPGESAGIIPARAGFTRGRGRRSTRRPDHPRSRGVYQAVSRATYKELGSSPLARGLHLRGTVPDLPRRIIPARAGFTRRVAFRRVAFRDHPRSRGVYATHPGHPRPGMGSSPLARGLRPRHPLGGGAFPDHPRSRGVYTCGSLESQRTRTLPDPCCLHCRPRARSAELR